MSVQARAYALFIVYIQYNATHRAKIAVSMEMNDICFVKTAPCDNLGCIYAHENYVPINKF